MTDSGAAEALRSAFNATIVGRLGSGSYGVTWRVDSVDVGGVQTVCAVKLLHAKQYRAHLVRREVEGLQAFDDERIVKLYDVCEIDVEGELRTALVCEYIPGGDVTSNFRESKPSYEEINGFALGLLAAVRTLHDSDRVHRDVKMENVILRRGMWDAPVLIDFGLSKAAEDSTYTKYPQLVGSLPYMSPEQLHGERARKASDLWSVGVLLYVLLTSRHPFVDNFGALTEDDVVDRVVGPPRPLPNGIPRKLEEIVIRLLSEEPYERGTASRALKDLRKARK